MPVTMHDVITYADATQHLVQADTPVGFTPAQVFPVIRHVDYLGDLQNRSSLVTAPLAGDLIITYVIDYPTHTSTMTADTVAEAGIARTALHDLAMNNLLAKADDAVISGSEEGFYFIALDGYYENALLLDTALWNAISTEIGPIVMSVPARDRVLFAPRDNAQAVQIMHDIRDDVLRDGAYGLSAKTFAWEDQRWVVVN